MYNFDTPVNRGNMASAKWDMAQAAGCPANIAPLSVADMEFPAAPEVIQEVTRLAQLGLWGYTYPDEAFKQAVIGWQQRRHSWHPETEWMVNTAGVISGLYTAIKAFTKPGAGVVVQPPVYNPFFEAVKNTGRTLVENPLKIVDGRYEMDFENLEAVAPKASMLILCSPHNPVGRVWRQQELEWLASICQRHKLVLFCDEIHSDIVYAPHRHTTLGLVKNAPLNNCVVATSGSKTFSLAGLACSSLFIPNAGLRGRFKKQADEDGSHFNSFFGVAATRAAFEKGQPWLEELLPYLRGNYEYLQGFIKERLPQLAVYPLEGTYLAWVDFSALRLPPAGLGAFLKQKAQFYLSMGAMFGQGGESFGRINLACPRAVLQEALLRLQQAIQRQ
ncbi:MAG: MalY/PatB family protein [Oscillospiraceae bacterium]